MIRAIFLLLALVVTSFAQGERRPINWEPFKYFIGSWEGTTKGEMGVGKAEREYKLILNETFLEVKNTTVFAPRTGHAKGASHEDIGYISYELARNRFNFRQFHVEGFVNHYILSAMGADNKPTSWETRSIENLEPGWRARESYKFVSADEFVETFELAPPGKDFFVFTQTTFKRKR